MKRLLLALALASTPAWAIMAVLQHSEPTTTVTGQMAWRCTYSVPGAGSVTYLFKNMCPTTIDVQ